MACAASNGRAYPVFGLWPLALRDELRRAMIEEDIRKVDVWTARYRLARGGSLVEILWINCALNAFLSTRIHASLKFKVCG